MIVRILEYEDPDSAIIFCNTRDDVRYVTSYLKRHQFDADMIQGEMDRGMPSERILLAGFSQGGAVALHTGLRYGKKLAGILALSCYLPTGDTLEAERDEINQEIPLMMAHGTMDPTIPVSNAIRTRQALKQLGYKIRWHEYRMMHEVCAEEIQDIRSWLLNAFTMSAKPEKS